MKQVIYFDQEDKNRDGMGWNVIDDCEGAIALRYQYLVDALAFCYRNNYEWALRSQVLDIR